MSQPKDSAAPGKPGVTRRKLLLAAAATPALAASGTQASAAPDGPPDHRRVTLQDTPHIRAYYARVKG